MTATADRHSRTFVTGFARGLSVIEAFGRGHHSLSVADVAERTGLDRAVTRRLLLTLVELGFASADGRRFELTSRVLKLGYSFLAASGFDATLRPYLDALSAEVGESVSVSVLEEADAVIVARSERPSHRIAFAVAMGMRLPAFASASGRVLLSALADDAAAALIRQSKRERFTRHTATTERDVLRSVVLARDEGYAVSWEELEEGMVSFAVPIRNRAGAIVASLNASANAERARKQRMATQILPKLKAAALRMAEILP